MTTGNGTTSRSLWLSRDFVIFWFVQTVAELGRAFSLIAMPLLVLRATGSIAQMGLLTAVASVGSVGTGLFAGLLADRMDRRKLMMVCDLARTVLYALIPIWWAITPQVWVLYVVMALSSVFGMIFQITYVTAVPNLVDRTQIVEANGRLEATNAIALVIGPMLAGMVFGLFGPTVTIAVNAATFAVSAAGLALIRFREPVEARPPVAARWYDLREGFLTGLRFLWRTPVLRALTVLLTVITFLSLGMTDVFIYHVRHDLGQGDQTVGYVMGVAAVGTVTGAALTSVLRRTWGFGRCWLGSYVICGIAVIAVGASSDIFVTAGLVLAYTFGMTLAGVCSMSLRQSVTPDHLLGRVTSAFWTVHSSLAPAGAALLTALAGHAGVRSTLLWAGLVFLTVVAVGLFTPIRQRDPEPVRAAPLPNGID